MEGFTKTAKMQCFKEGGSVQKQVKDYTRRDRKSVETDDIAQDKKIVKKAFRMHDEQEHPGESTDLSKLKKGGRAKKEVGTVKKYKVGGVVENQYAAKKTDKDIKDIANTKRQKPALLCGGGKAMGKYASGGTVTVSAPYDTKYQDKTTKEWVPTGKKTGGKVKKADGGFIDTIKEQATDLKNKIIGTPEQNAEAQKYMDRQAAQGSKLAKFFGGKADAESAATKKCGGGYMKGKK